MNIFDLLLGRKKEPSKEELDEQERLRQETILYERIRVGEGLRLNLYKCPANKWSIGYGHNLEDNGITRDVAEILLNKDITNAKLDLYNNFPWVKNLDYERQYVLVEMVYNLGIKKFKGFKKMLAACQKGEWDKAANEMLDSDWHKQVKSRAESLADIMKGKEDD